MLYLITFFCTLLNTSATSFSEQIISSSEFNSSQISFAAILDKSHIAANLSHFEISSKVIFSI
jgi:hypothetical protein